MACVYDPNRLYCVYFLASKSRVIYIGITRHLAVRIAGKLRLSRRKTPGGRTLLIGKFRLSSTSSGLSSCIQALAGRLACSADNNPSPRSAGTINAVILRQNPPRPPPEGSAAPRYCHRFFENSMLSLVFVRFCK